MRHMKKAIALLVLISLIAISIWLWRRHETSSVSPTQASSVSIQARQQANTTPANAIAAPTDSSDWARHQAARMNANDVESLTRSFKEANDCLLYHAARHELNAILNDERLADLSKETLATLENIDATSSKYLWIARQTESFCRGSDQNALAQVYIDTMFKAAKLGSPDAESCFVISKASSPSGTISPTAEWMDMLLDRYLKYAPTFTQKALERGDPRVAADALYQYIKSPGIHPSRMDDVQKADPYLTWQAARLASLRVLPEQRRVLEERLALFKQQNLLRPDDIERADEWARATYEREHAGQPPINLYSHAPCYSSPDLAP